jgi:hypothetical protein
MIDHSPQQADPEVHPFSSELFLCSIWPLHEYSAKNKAERLQNITLISQC